MAKKIDELQEVLRKKDEDMKQMEERYKRYVEKARTVSPPQQSMRTFLRCPVDQSVQKPPLCAQVIKTLDPGQQPAAPDVQALKNQLTEKDKRIQHLEV